MSDVAMALTGMSLAVGFSILIVAFCLFVAPMEDDDGFDDPNSAG